MKKILSMLLIAVALTGCTKRTEFGRCIGIGGEEKPHLEYEVSYWNIFMGFIFSETIVVPIVVAADQLYCPVAKKDKSEMEDYEDSKRNRSNNSHKDDNRHPRADSFEVPVEDKSFNKEKLEVITTTTTVEQKEVVVPVEKEYPVK